MLVLPPLSGINDTIKFLLAQVRDILNAEEVAICLEEEGPLWVYREGNLHVARERTLRLGGLYVPLQGGGWLIAVNPQKEFSEEYLRQYCSRAIQNARQYDVLQECVRLDPLTGIPNRMSLKARLEEEIERGENFCVVFLDLNDFKVVNDRFGHLVGDEILIKAAQVLRSALRSRDFLARYGGDEFVAVLPGTDDKEGKKIAERLGSKEVDCGKGVVVTFSWGLAAYPTDASELNELLKCADTRMYEHKARLKKGATKSGNDGKANKDY
ncbi:GGDEF domain-containing protein [Moorellaceae bacterium AZ2]